ncbi:MAG: MFS transporter [Spirochaetales bacterium]|nr:MAG: MFS transporter [Spirochaetales bacterium]
MYDIEIGKSWQCCPAIDFSSFPQQSFLSMNPSQPHRKLWNRNFLLLWQGQFISSIGKQLFAMAAMLWLKTITDSGTLMGMVMTVAMLPMVVIGPIAGVIVDRWDRKRLIAWTDIAGGIAVAAAGAVFFLLPDRLAILVGVVFTVTVATGLLDTLSQPSISASLPLLSPAEKLEAANSINMAGLQIAVFISQGLAGLLFVLTGMPVLIMINAATYLCAGISELFIHLPHRSAEADPSIHPWLRFKKYLMEGFRFVYHNRGMRTGLLLNMALNFFVAPVLVLLPFYVEDYIGLPQQWYGYFMAVFGLGGLLGFILAGAFPTRGLAREIAVSGSLMVQTGLIVVMLFFKFPGFQMPAFAVIGLLNGILNVNFNTLIQQITPGNLLGRVQSLSTTAVTAVLPLGMAVSGIIFDAIGKNVPVMFAVSGGMSFLFSIICIFSKEYRRFLRYTVS